LKRTDEQLLGLFDAAEQGLKRASEGTRIVVDSLATARTMRELVANVGERGMGPGRLSFVWATYGPQSRLKRLCG